MNEMRLDPEFSSAFRDALIARVDRRRRWGRLWLGAGVVAGLGLAGTAAATAAWLVEPGGTAVAELAGPVVETHTGTATVELGEPPEGATNIRIDLWCLSPGAFAFADGASMTCSEADAGTRTAAGPATACRSPRARPARRSPPTPARHGGSRRCTRTRRRPSGPRTSGGRATGS